MRRKPYRQELFSFRKPSVPADGVVIFPDVIPPVQRRKQREAAAAAVAAGVVAGSELGELDVDAAAVQTEQRRQAAMKKWEKRLEKAARLRATVPAPKDKTRSKDPSDKRKKKEDMKISEEDKLDQESDAGDSCQGETTDDGVLSDSSGKFYKKHGYKVDDPPPKCPPGGGDGKIPDEVAKAKDAIAKKLAEKAKSEVSPPPMPPTDFPPPMPDGAAARAKKHDNDAGSFAGHKIVALKNCAEWDGYSIWCDRACHGGKDCKIDLHYGTGPNRLTDEQIFIALKRWILVGYALDRADNALTLGKSPMEIRKIHRAISTDSRDYKPRKLAEKQLPDELVKWARKRIHQETGIWLEDDRIKNL